MTATLASVLAAVEGRVGYLRASIAAPDKADGDAWSPAASLTEADLAAAVDAGMAARDGGADRQVVVSLLAQSYAFKVGAVSLAAYAVGLPWPSPAADDVTVRLARGRATGLALRAEAILGDPDDVSGLVAALLDRHLQPITERLRARATIGGRLLRGNVAASAAAAFRAVEGAARDRGDAVERAGVRERAEAFFGAAAWLGGTGRFERVEAGGGDGWFWTRTSCCLYYKETSGATCDDCSLVPAAEMEQRRRAELEGAPS